MTMRFPRISVSTAVLYAAVVIDFILAAHPAFAQVAGGSTTANTSQYVTQVQTQVKTTTGNIGQTVQLGCYGIAGCALMGHGVQAMTSAGKFDILTMSRWVKGSGIVAGVGVVVGMITGTTPW